jgi:hypothetical protein
MRKINIRVLACLMVVALAGALQLAGCTNTGQPSTSSQSMIEGRGADYTH